MVSVMVLQKWGPGAREIAGHFLVCQVFSSQNKVISEKSNHF